VSLVTSFEREGFKKYRIDLTIRIIQILRIVIVRRMFVWYNKRTRNKILVLLHNVLKAKIIVWINFHRIWIRVLS